MNCAIHPEVTAVAYCRTCGKPLCESCVRPVQGTVFCDEHAVVQPASPEAGYSPYTSPYTAPVSPSVTSLGASPAFAFLLGLIPGVGAIYNGQYVKGLVHVIVLGVFISIAAAEVPGAPTPIFVLLTMAWFFYMAFEAYHTASKRQRGETVDEFSSVLPLAGQGRGFPIGPIVLIALGVLLLLNTMGVLPIRFLVTYAPPVFLIMLGCYWLYLRVTAKPADAPVAVPGEVHSDVR